MSTRRFVSVRTGQTVYALMRDTNSGQIFNVNAEDFEAYNPANFLEYAIGTTEQGSSGTYMLVMPSPIPAGVFDVEFRMQSDANPAESDGVVDAGIVEWNGSEFVTERGTDGAYLGTPPSESQIAQAVAQLLQTAHGSGTWTTANVSGLATSQLQDAILAKLAGQISYLGPVGPSGEAKIVRGDDYLHTDGRALEWSSESWPDLTDATIRMSATPQRGCQGAILDKITGTVVTPTGTKLVRVELTAEHTNVLSVGRYKFDVEAELANGSIVTLVLGEMTVLSDVTR